jgi:hypothetical protein
MRLRGLKLLDVVRTKFGTIAVVSELNSHGEAALAFANERTEQKMAWYKPDELTLVGHVTDMVEAYTGAYSK